MKKIKNLSESEFLKLVFAFLTAAFLLAALCMPDRGQMISGLWQIMSQPCKVATSNFAVGGYGATFLNMGLVGLVCLTLYGGLKAKADNVSTLAFILTVGFGAWGINIVNMWPTILGVVLHAVIRKEKIGDHTNQMLFSTGLAPFMSGFADIINIERGCLFAILPSANFIVYGFIKTEFLTVPSPSAA